jgi:hypothetical protein
MYNLPSGPTITCNPATGVSILVASCDVYRVLSISSDVLDGSIYRVEERERVLARVGSVSWKVL